MRRPLLVLALLAGVAASTTQSVPTASSSVPGSTAAHRQTTVTGGMLTALDYTVTAGTITSVEARLRGTDLLTSSVTARFGAGVTVTCTAGLLTVLDALTGLGEATYSCAGLSETAERPSPLQITVS